MKERSMMPIKKLAVEIKSVILAFTVVSAMVIVLIPGLALGDGYFRKGKNSQGLILPFKAVSISLPDFVHEYARVTSTTIVSEGAWTEGPQGNVTLLLRHPLKSEELTELFYRVIGDSGYAVVDATSGNGWIIMRSRDARALALPVYAMANVPDSNRLVTDAASNIRKINSIISKIDNSDGANHQKELASSRASDAHHSCGEIRIEKLVVENLGVQETNKGQPSSLKSTIEKGK